MTDKQFEQLQIYETNMRTAVRSSYSRAMTHRQLQELTDLYCEITGDPSFQNVCRQCESLSLLKKVGTLYFSEKESRQNKKEKITN